MLRKFFVNLKKGTEHLNYGRHIIEAWGTEHFNASHKPVQSGSEPDDFRILDIGCGHGTDLLNIRNSILSLPGLSEEPRLKLYGIENYPPYISECALAGIKIYSIDIEHDSIPADDTPFDLIISNQVLEHTKEIFWIMSEAADSLKSGGKFIIGVPNLASLHNRLLLLFGIQPTSIQTYSAHVRGFTYKDFKFFAEKGDFFRLKRIAGSNFYPFPEWISRPLSFLLPTFSWAIFFELERTEKHGSFLECLHGDHNLLETPYYGSPQNPSIKGNHHRRALPVPVSGGKIKKKSMKKSGSRTFS
jgi:SAM-dependent methyltransferase